MNDDLLTRLSDVETSTTTPPLVNIQRRAATMQRARHGRRLGLVAAGAGALAIGGFALPPADVTPDSDVLAAAQPFVSYLQLQPAQATEGGAPDCNTGSGSVVDPSDWATDPDITRTATLLSEPPFPVTKLGVAEYRSACPPVLPLAVLYSTAPVKGVSVWAGVQYPFAGVTDPSISDVTVRGEAGELRVVNNVTYITWPDIDGSWWFAMGSGMPQEDLLAAVNGLQFDGATLDTSTVPDGFATADLAPATASTVVRTWRVQYGDDPEVGVSGEGEPLPVAPRDEVTLEVTAASAPPPEVAAAANAAFVRFVDVNGRQAVYYGSADPSIDPSGLLSWQVDGVTYTLRSHHGLEDAIRLAEDVEHVALTDERVVPLIPLDF